ncbi:MAG TPA: hypothetical protein VER12_12320 [Polyangiaceae bacterium]|nr:hypothetical protein [Polyangiaceae bacterium]
MNWHRRIAACFLISLLSACSTNSSDPTEHGPAGEQDISNVIYVGGVTDEALARMLDATPKNDPRQAVIVDSPDLTAPLPKDGPATFQFHLATQASRSPDRHLPSAQPRNARLQRSFHEFLQLLAPERIAHAHGTPYRGVAYYLVFMDKESKPILQVFTPETSFTPGTVDWQHLTEAPQPLTLQISSAYFEDDSIPTDGGPFVGGTFPFRIE